MQTSLRKRYHENKVFQENGFGVKRVKTKNKTRFDFDEIKKMMELDLSKSSQLDKVRDLFIVGCYTGLRFSDWHKVNQTNIVIEGDTKLLEILTKKGKQLFYIPFLSELKIVLEKYDYQLPKISSQKFNLKIKVVAELASIDTKYQRIYSKAGAVTSEWIEKHKMISSHCARRSFASNFYDLGISPFVLMQITGHTTEKQFFEYIDVDAKKLALRFSREVTAATKRANPS